MAVTLLMSDMLCPIRAQVKCNKMEIDPKRVNADKPHEKREVKDMRHPEMTPEKIAHRLVVIRTAFGLDPMEMADHLDIHRPSWSRFEKASRAIPLEKAQIIVERFGVTLDYIYLAKTDKLDYDTRQRILRAEERLARPSDEA